MLHQIKGSAFFVFAFLLSCLGSSGQQTLNSVRTLTAQRPFANEADILPAALDPSEVVQSTQYSDGLGRPVQTVIKKMSPAQKDLVDMHVYDNWGREVQKLLPFVSNVAQSGDVANDGNYKTDASAQQAAFSQGQYTGETYYYSKVDFENSPLNRVQNTYAPGNSWVGSSRATSVQYLLNTTTDNVRAWATSNTVQGTIPTTAAPYTPGALYKFISTDEQNRQTITFKDQDGNIVLKKVQQTGTSDNGVTGTGHAGWLCTYYVYDDYNKPAFCYYPEGCWFNRWYLDDFSKLGG